MCITVIQLNQLLANIENVINRRVRYSSKKNVTMVTVYIVKEAISILNKGKSDRLLGLQTGHLIHSPTICHAYLSFLYSSMLVHGYLPDDILHSIIVPIPKNTKGNMSCSDIYREIALCSPLSKLFECIILNQFSSCLHSSENQFAFKHEHSTVICTTVFKETVQYYRNRNSNVYACLVDATKAFDYLKFGKLEILLKTKLPCIVIRTLFAMYSKQCINIKWNECYSKTFSASNGVRQGGIISPVLFNPYMDKLITQLKREDIGCHIGHKFVGCLCYADDLKGGHNMLTKCKSFANAFIIQTCGNNKQLDYATPQSTNCACSAVFKQNRFNSV